MVGEIGFPIGEKIVKNLFHKKIIVVFRFSYPSKFQGEIINQGSITINGISLTVVTCDNNKFTVSLIPHTAKHTNLEKLKIGDNVNIETDILAKYIKAQLKLFGGKLND